MKRMRKSLALTLASLILAGCATANHGPMQQIRVESDADAATVTLERCGSGSTKSTTTPATVQVSRRATRCSIFVWTPGEREKEIRLHRRPANAWESLAAGGVIISEAWDIDELGIAVLVAVPVMIASATVDYASGAIWVQEPAEIFVNFFEEDDEEFDDSEDEELEELEESDEEGR